jgi:hypothetical protein
MHVITSLCYVLLYILLILIKFLYLPIKVFCCNNWLMMLISSIMGVSIVKEVFLWKKSIFLFLWVKIDWFSFFFFFFFFIWIYLLVLQDLGKMLWRMGQWEVAQSHRQIIFNLRSLYGLCCQIVNILVIKFEFILFNSDFSFLSFSSDSFLWDRQHTCNEG